MIHVWNRKMIEEGQAMLGAALISISEPNRKVNIVNEVSFADILRLYFHDITTLEEAQIDGLTLFTHEQAHAILDFAKRHQDREIIIHCAAGMSRSVAVGNVLARWLNEIVDYKVADTDQFRNVHVCNVMMRAIYRREMGEDYEESNSNS